MKWFKTLVRKYIEKRDKVPPFYVNENGGLYAKADEVYNHPKVQKDLEEYGKISGITIWK